MGVFVDKTEGAIWEDLRPVRTRREIVAPIRKVDIQSVKPWDRGQVTKQQNELLPALQTDGTLTGPTTFLGRRLSSRAWEHHFLYTAHLATALLFFELRWFHIGT